MFEEWARIARRAQVTAGLDVVARTRRSNGPCGWRAPFYFNLDKKTTILE